MPHPRWFLRSLDMRDHLGCGIWRPLIGVMWHDHTCDVTYSCVCHDSFICVTWLLYMCVFTNVAHSTLQHTLQQATLQHTLQHTLQQATLQHALQHTLQHTPQHTLHHILRKSGTFHTATYTATGHAATYTATHTATHTASHTQRMWHLQANSNFE